MIVSSIKLSKDLEIQKMNLVGLVNNVVVVYDFKGENFALEWSFYNDAGELCSQADYQFISSSFVNEDEFLSELKDNDSKLHVLVNDTPTYFQSGAIDVLDSYYDEFHLSRIDVWQDNVDFTAILTVNDFIVKYKSKKWIIPSADECVSHYGLKKEAYRLQEMMSHVTFDFERFAYAVGLEGENLKGFEALRRKRFY